MKKFLTVLLALSVVFTYSFATVGTAFATTDESTFNGNVNQAQSQITSSFNAAYNNAVTTLDDKAQSGVEISKDAWKGAADLYKTKVLASITSKTNEIKADYATNGEKSVNELIGLYTDIPVKQTDIYDAIYKDADVQNAAARTQFATEKKVALDAVKSVDLSIYSTTTPIGETSYNAKAKKVVDDAVAGIEAVTINNTADVAAVKTALASIGKCNTATMDASTNVIGSDSKDGTGYLKSFTKVVKNETVVKYQLSTAKATELSLKTISQESAEATTLDAKKSAYISQVNANASQFIADNASATGDLLAAVKAEKDAYVAGMTEIINAAKTNGELTTIAADATALAKPEVAGGVVTSSYVVNAKAISELVTYANKYKAYKNADGSLVKDADAIDKIVAAAKVTAYKSRDKWDGLDAAKTAIAGDTTNVVAIDSEEVAKAKAAIENGRKGAIGEDNYYAAEASKVNALFDALLAKVDACKTTAEVKAVYSNNAAVTGLSDIKDKDAVRTLIAGLTAFTTNKAKLDAYGEYLNAGKSGNDVRTYPASFSKSDKDSYFADFYAEKGARTEAEVAALLDAAKAEYDAVKTVGQLSEQKATVEKLIANIPVIVTVDSDAAVQAAFDATTAYNTAAGKTMSNTDISNIATLKLAISALYKAEKKVVDDKIANLPTTVVIADKDMYKGLATEIEAFNAKCETGKIFESMNKADINTVSLRLSTIRGLERDAVEAAIDALPLNITLDNKDAVEAARKAYDAYVAEYTDYTVEAPAAFNKNAAKDINATKYQVLTDAEKVIKEAVDSQNARITAGVKATKITAKATAGKKYIKLTWKKGSTFKVDGYKVYRATKKNGTYKLVKTTKSTSFKNTKLKSGKTYYYKVRGYRTVDGKKVYTQYSAKVYKKVK